MEATTLQQASPALTAGELAVAKDGALAPLIRNLPAAADAVRQAVPKFDARLIPVSAIVAGYNPRKFFDPDALREMTQQIKLRGSIDTPILVLELALLAFKLLAGERRVRCTFDAFGADALIPGRIYSGDDAYYAVIGMVENIQRQQMSPAEEAEAAAKLLGELGGDRAETARQLGLSARTLDKRLALMNCSDKVREALTLGRIQLGHAELLAALTRTNQDATLQKLLGAAKMPTVEQCRASLEHAARSLATAIFDQADCAGCPHNSDVQASMFGDAVSPGYCTDGACFDGKLDAALQARLDALEGEYPMRRIVRPGDNLTVVALRADVPKGVGAAQAQACQGCQKYGAVVMAIPDKMGQVVTGICADTTCNATMVAKNLKAQADAAAQPPGASAKGGSPRAALSSADASSAGKGRGSTAPPASTLVQVTGALEAYRRQLWRDALRKEIADSAVVASRVLLAAAVCGQASNIKAGKLAAHLAGLAGVSLGKGEAAHSLGGADITEVLVCLEEMRDVQRSAFARDVTSAMVEAMTDKMVVAILNHFEIALSRHFRLD